MAGYRQGIGEHNAVPSYTDLWKTEPERVEKKQMEDSKKPSPTQVHVLLGGVSCIIFIVKECVPSTDRCVVQLGSKLAEGSGLQPPHIHLCLFLSFSSP